MTDRALARIDTGAILLSSNFDEMTKKAKLLLGSGLLPESIKSPEQAIVVMLKGQELGIPPMEALNRINVIKGKPSLSASLMAALVERAYGPKALIVEDSTNDHCTVSVWKPGWDRRREVTFSMDDAKRAGIATHMYQKYPRAMLRSRAISEACETYFQAIVGGLYTPEELGDGPAPEDMEDPAPIVTTVTTVTVDEDTEVDADTGEIIEGTFTEADADDPEGFDEPEENGIDAGWDNETIALLRDLNKLRRDKELPSDHPQWQAMSTGVRKTYLIDEIRKHFLTWNGKLKTAEKLEQMKGAWGDHPAWDEKVNNRWLERMMQFEEVPA